MMLEKIKLLDSDAVNVCERGGGGGFEYERASIV